MENLGFLSAIGAALAWGTFMVPFKKSRSDKLMLFQAMMSVGILLSGLVLSVALDYSLRPNLYGLLAGILWGLANAMALVAVFNLGMCRAAPLMASLVVVSSFLWGVLVFGELPTAMLAGFAAVALIILGVILVSVTGGLGGHNFKKGVLAGVAAGLIFGSQLAPVKIGHTSTQEVFFSITLGIFLSAVLITLFNRTRLSTVAAKESLLSGIIWNIGNLLSLVSLSLIGLSKTGPISQSSILIAVIWGLFYFKEVTKYKLKLQILAGAIILLVGVIILGSA